MSFIDVLECEFYFSPKKQDKKKKSVSNDKASKNHYLDFAYIISGNRHLTKYQTLQMSE